MADGRSRSVLITGATRGIGLACVRALAGRSFRVYAGYRSDEDGRRLEEEGGERVVPVRLDVTDAHQITEAADRIARDIGDAGLYGLVNNAGMVVAGPLEALPLDRIREQLEVNVVGVVAVTQAVLPLLRATRGRIINISSINGRLATPWVGPYAASKHALEAISDSWRVELRRWGIYVSVIQPGAIETDIWHASRERAIRISGQFSPSDLERYGGIIARLQEVRRPGRAIPARHVADRVVHALTARRPRVRYVVGTDARAGLILKALLPTRWLDRLLGARRKA